MLTGLFCAGGVQAEQIKRFDVVLEVKEDATVVVTETIFYDFEELQRHGIFRTIPVSYRARGGTYRLRVDDIVVHDEQGNAISFTTSTPGRNLEIKIGDADRFVTGEQTYVVQYAVGRAINYFDDHQELYWNVTGDEWEIPIRESTVELVLPDSVTVAQTEMICFTGPRDSTTLCDDFAESATGWRVSSGELAAGEGLTAALRMPTGAVYQPTFWEQMLATVADNWVVGVPLVTLVAMSWLWRIRGRDPGGDTAIVAQYEPPEGLTPAELGALVDEKVDQVDVSGELIHLAVQGYIKISRIEKKLLFRTSVDYQFDLLRAVDGGLTEFDRELLERMFDGSKSVQLSDLKNSFSGDLQEIRRGIYRALVAREFFPRNPQRVRGTSWGIGIAVVVIGVAFGALYEQIVVAGSLAISGVLIGIFGTFLPVKTQKGVAARAHALGLKEYLSVAEKDRLAFHNAPEKNPEHFDALLPYAIVLGVEEQWAKQFEGMQREEPGWYSGVGRPFNATALASDMRGFSNVTGMTMASSASSGGSGFSGGGSGGGFGGGGGGSW